MFDTALLHNWIKWEGRSKQRPYKLLFLQNADHIDKFTMQWLKYHHVLGNNHGEVS